MTYIKIAVIVYVCTYLLFIHYAAIMRLRDLRDAGLLTKEAAFFGYQGLGVGYFLDCLINIVLCTVIFMELPRELTVSARVTRWRERETLKLRGGKIGQFTAWLFKLRKQRAKIIGERYLDNVDSRGVHRG